MDQLSLQTIAEYAGGNIRHGELLSKVIGVSTDTRNLAVGELFLALSGENFDGHGFLAQAEQMGAVGAIVGKNLGSTSDRSFALIEVEDTLLAYQRLAAAYRRALTMRVVAITGSNGKTSTKDFTAAVLSRRYRVLKTEGNFNNHIGVPRMLLRAGSKDEVAVLELGMNHPGEIKPLAGMVLPDIAIITNIGTAHIEHMGSTEAIAEEKGTLLESVTSQGHVILPTNDPFAAKLAKRSVAPVIHVGLHRGDLKAENIRTTLAGCEFDVDHGGERVRASIGVPGEHMIVNALFGIAAGLVLGMSLDEAVRGLSEAQLTKGRLEWRNVGDLQVLDDSYNANPDSVVAALATLAALPCNGRRIAVLGRMGELGAHSEAGHRRVGEAAAEEKIDLVITVGDEAAIIARHAEANGVAEVHAVDDTAAAAKLLLAMADPKDLILIKGSRSASMERIISALEGAPKISPAIH